MKRNVHLTAQYSYSPKQVWRALTDSALMAQWLMPNDFQPKVGHEFKFRTKPAPGFDGIVRCRVTDLQEERLLAFTWKGGGIDTVVTFRLEPTANGTRLELSQTGFVGLKGAALGYLLGNGWRAMLTKKLPKVLRADSPLETSNGCGGDTTVLWKFLNRVWHRDSTKQIV